MIKTTEIMMRKMVQMMIMTKKTMVKMERTKVIKELEEKEFY